MKKIDEIYEIYDIHRTEPVGVAPIKNLVDGVQILDMIECCSSSACSRSRLIYRMFVLVGGEWSEKTA